MNPIHLSDEQLIARVKRNCAKKARLLAELLVDLIDIEDRRIHLRAACASMQEYCRRHFEMSPSEAWRRSTAARLVRRVPVLLEYVRRGEVDLSTLMLLRHFIDEHNAEELIRATRCKSKRQIERILEARSPREGRSKRANGESRTPATLLERLEAVSDALHLLEAAITNETRILIERARHLLNDAMPNASLGDLVHRAFADLVESLEARKTELQSKRSPRRPPVKAGRVSRATEYDVFVRDGFQCTFTSAEGVRCRATTYLEVDHIIPRAKGGSNEIHNLRCVCHAHNQHHAELSFGKAFIQSRILKRQSRAPARLRSARALG